MTQGIVSGHRRKVPDLRTIWRPVYHRFLRWGTILRSHPLRTILAGALLAVILLAALCGRYLGRISHPIFQATQTHPFLGRSMHVLINAVPDMAFLLLALAGLTYLMPGITDKLAADKAVRGVLVTLFVVLGLLAIL